MNILQDCCFDKIAGLIKVGYIFTIEVSNLYYIYNYPKIFSFVYFICITTDAKLRKNGRTYVFEKLT